MEGAMRDVMVGGDPCLCGGSRLLLAFRALLATARPPLLSRPESYRRHYPRCSGSPPLREPHRAPMFERPATWGSLLARVEGIAGGRAMSLSGLGGEAEGAGSSGGESGSRRATIVEAMTGAPVP